MASLRRKPNSRYWIACFNLANGGRSQRSTKTTNKKLAQKFADEYEAAARNRATETQVRRVLSDLHRMHSGSALRSTSVREYLEQWMAAKNGTISESTKAAYSAAARDLCRFLGDRADGELLYLGKADIGAFRDDVASSRTATTANNRLKILRIALQQAWRDGVVDENPAAKVSLLKCRNDESSRRPFTSDELRRLIRLAEGDWKGVILCGLYTGQRLGDLVRLRWSNIDLERATLSLTTQKTQRRQILPIAKPLRCWFETRRQEGASVERPVFPTLSLRLKESGKVSTLSNQFFKLLSSAGLVAPRSHEKRAESPGRKGRRVISDLSFHSLRHTATSLMKNAGVSPAIVQEFVGHNSKAMSEHYTHIELASLRDAAEALPIFDVD
jgi:integrase